MKYNVSYKSCTIYHSILVNADDERTAAQYIAATTPDAEIIATKPATRDDERPNKPVVTVPADFTAEPATTPAAAPAEEPATTPAAAPAVLPIGAQSFPRLYKLIENHYKNELKTYAHYIRRGYFPSWAEAHRTDPDRGINQYLTPARLKRYKEGKTSREEAIKHATAKAAAELEKRKADEIEKLNRAAIADAPESLAIFITWNRSRVWGFNPRAELRTGCGAPTIGTASGCGYDKRSAAMAEALNDSPAVLKILYTAAEKAARKGAKISAEAGTRARWGDVLGYGAGYSLLPYFEGGTGESCITNILTRCGFPLSQCFHSSATNTYIYTNEKTAKN